MVSAIPVSRQLSFWVDALSAMVYLYGDMNTFFDNDHPADRIYHIYIGGAHSDAEQSKHRRRP